MEAHKGQYYGGPGLQMRHRNFWVQEPEFLGFDAICNAPPKTSAVANTLDITAK